MSSTERTIKTATLPFPSSPAGIARVLVRGFSPSISASISRFNPIAAVRAPTIAIRIQNAWYRVGRPRAASSAAVNANGRANTVCANLIISRKIFTRPNRLAGTSP